MITSHLTTRGEGGKDERGNAMGEVDGTLHDRMRFHSRDVGL